MSWGLFPWRLLTAGVLLLTIFVVGFLAGQRRIEQAWSIERLQQQATALQRSLQMEQVRSQQEHINQQISTDYETTKSLLAHRSPVLRDSAISLCLTDNSMSAAPEPATSLDASSAYPIPDSNADAAEVSCKQLIRDATDTTLMVLFFQRWYADQAGEFAVPDRRP